MPPSQHNGPKRFKATIAIGVKEVETRLSLRRADLDKAWADLDNQWPGVRQRMSDMGIVKRAPLDEHTVELNVRGSLVNFRRPLVDAQKEEDGLDVLASLFDSVWDERLPRDNDGRIVLDESPTCVKHLLHKKLGGSETASASQGMEDAVLADERPYLLYTSRILGLSPEPAPAAQGMVVTGGTTILGPDEKGPLTAEIQNWIPGKPQELKLLYRASRDGWHPENFRVGCGAAAPTISLFRVMAQATGRSYSVIGGCSTASFAPPPADGHARARVLSPGAFVFMLKDGSVGSPSSFQPTKWGGPRANRPTQIIGPGVGPRIPRADRSTQIIGPGIPINYCSDALRLASRNGKIATRGKPLAIPDDSPFLGLNGRRATEIEVFEVVREATVSPPPAKRARPSNEIVDNTTIDAPRPMTAQEVSGDLHHFGAHVAGPLREEQTALFHAQTSLVQASKKAAASAHALKVVYGPEVAGGKKDQVVELSVRGIRMTTLRSTLQACPESALTARFDSEKWAPTDKDLDDHGRQVVDCRPSCFSKVLDVLRLRERAEWAGEDWKQGWGGFTRVSINAVDRGEFEQFVHMHFPGCERFVMDCVETREESMA